MKIRVSTNSNATESNFETFFRSYFSQVSRYVARRLPNESHDEVVASTFVVAWRKFEQVSSPSLAWLYGIARYEVAHERRRLSRSPIEADLSDLALTDDLALEDILDLMSEMQRLSENDLELLRLIHWEDLSRRDVAVVLGCSVNVVNVRYHRAIERLSLALNRTTKISEIPRTNDRNPREEP